MANPFEEYDRKYGTLSVSAKKLVPPDRGRFNTPAPKAEVPDQCKPCANGEHNFCNGCGCGCRCTQEEGKR